MFIFKRGRRRADYILALATPLFLRLWFYSFYFDGLKPKKVFEA